jgi:hypothetical protein
MPIDLVPQLKATCHNRLCCNPEHLTPRCNAEGKALQRRPRRSAASATHAITPELIKRVTGIDLTQEQIDQRLAPRLGADAPYEQIEPLLRELEIDRSCTVEQINGWAGITFTVTPEHLARYFKENPQS